MSSNVFISGLEITFSFAIKMFSRDFKEFYAG